MVIPQAAGQCQRTRGDLGGGAGFACKDHKAAAIGGQLLFGNHRRIGGIKAQDIRVEHPVAVVFPPGGDVAQDLFLARVQFTRVHFKPHVPLGGDPGAEFDVQLAARGVAGARAHVAAGDRGRQEQRRVVLHHQPLQRVVAVRQPDTLGFGQNAKVDAPATRSAAFDLNLWEVRAQTVQQRIRSTGLPGVGHGQYAVVVPFDVFNRMRAQQGRDAVIEEIAHLRQRHVQRFLLAAEDLVFGPQRPVGMGAVQVAVRVDHLWLKPDAERHAFAVHMVDQRPKTVRVFARVYFPVRQRRGVIIALAEPAIVQHKPLGPK